MKIGVLALQGAFIEHLHILRRLGVESTEVRLPRQLETLDGLIIPGGESTTIGKLAVAYDLIAPIRRFAEKKALWGTCAGMILMAKDVETNQALLQLMDIRVKRNAFGRQIDSFEIPLPVAALEQGSSRPFPAVFIRAPGIVAAGGDVSIIATLPDNTAVAAWQGKLLATAFHPELSEDDRFHRYFLTLVESSPQP